MEDQKKINSKEKVSKNIGDSFSRRLGWVSNNIGIDLGTTTTVVYVEGKGVVLQEPTLVALNTKTKQVIATGQRVRTMIGRTPEYISIVQPIQEGVMADYEITTQLLEHILRRVQEKIPKILGPKVVVGVPCQVTSSEIEAIKDSTLDAGARQVEVVYEPFAAAVGIGNLLHQNKASMVIDIGGGSSDTIVIALGEVIDTNSIRIAGDVLDKDILDSLKENKNLVVGIRTAEDLKMAIFDHEDDKEYFSVQGRNAYSGLPLEVEVQFEEVLGYTQESMNTIADNIQKFVENISSEILSDLKNSSVYFVGGGSFIKSLAEKISAKTNLEIEIPKDHTIVVAKGTARIAEDIKKYKKYFL